MVRAITQHPVIATSVFFTLVAVLRFLYAVRGELWRRANAVVWAIVLMVFVMVVCLQLRVPHGNLVASGVAALYYLASPRRKRHIPLRVKRQVIARHQRNTGVVYDPIKDHIDHIVPFARGGNHSADNLRIIPKAQNLRKGKKWPSPLDLFWVHRPVVRAEAPSSGSKNQPGDAIQRVR